MDEAGLTINDIVLYISDLAEVAGLYWTNGWRRGWDSNPRALSDNTLSRRARYDHFGTSPLG